MSKRLYILGGPVSDIRNQFRTRGLNGHAPGIIYLAGTDLIDPTKYATGDEVKWAIFGIIGAEMLDRMEKHFGDRTPFVEAIEWFGARL